MKVFNAILWDSIRHAWRLRLPFILIFLLGLVLLTLPNWVMHDGSPEGKLRIMMTYSGHLQIYALSFAALFYSIWFEKFERENKVNLLIATYPVSHHQKILARLMSYVLILWGSSLIFQAGIGFLTLRTFQQFDISIQEKSELKSRLLTVREYSPLQLIEDQDFEQKRIERQFMQAFPLNHGIATGFDLLVTPQQDPLYLRGKLMSLQDIGQAQLRFEVRHENRLVWAAEAYIQPSVEFYQLLPAELSKLSPLRLDLIQGNEEKKPLYYVQAEPLSLSRPKGSFIGNLLRATMLSSLLIFTMAAIGIFLAQILSFQGSLFTSLVIYIIGSFKQDIHELLFSSGMPNIPGFSTEQLDPSTIFYSILWKPLLFITPDFQVLNPTSKLMNGEYIPWDDFIHVGSTTLPFLCVTLLYALYFLPRQEVDKRS